MVGVPLLANSSEVREQSMAKVHPGYTLADLIQKTADELRTLRDKPVEDAVMAFSGCELELAVTVGAEAGGGIKFWLVDASTKARAETVSKVKLSFMPIAGKTIAAVAESSPARSRRGDK